jgi:hypothetical protein
MVQGFYHHANRNISLLKYMQVITVKNVTYACHNISVFLIDVKHLPSRLSVNINKHRYLKWYGVSILKMISDLLNALRKYLVAIHVNELGKFTFVWS